MKIRFIKPDGMYAKGDIIDIEAHVAELYLQRKVVEEVKDKAMKPATVKRK